MELMDRALKWGWLLYLRLRVAFTLRWMRIKADLTRVEAAQRLGIDEKFLASYEIGRASPPMRLIAQMMTTYQARDNAIFFFCTLGALPRTLRIFLYYKP